MTEPDATEHGAIPAGIFISYRRDDSGPGARRLYAELARRYGKARVFIDTTTIGAGRDFPESIAQSIAGADVVLAVIGPGWLKAGSADQRRLDNPADWVRRELELALAGTARVVPVLLAGSRLPKRAQLPQSLQPLASRQAVALTDDAWDADVARLALALEGRAVTPARLPTQPTAFVGREEEIETIAKTLRSHRLVTLTGPGGSGKTRLAVETARGLVDEFPEGVHFAPLESVESPALVTRAIASSLNLRETATTTFEALLVDELRHRRVLLVLDNLEHLLPAATAISQLLDATDQLRVLVTSRVPLGVRGEQELAVPPLRVPAGVADPAAIANTEGVRLFVARAQSISPGFAIDAENAAAVAAICRRVDGLPLAIELAAGRVRALDPEQILARLDRRLPMLVGGPADLPLRQQTLRATIAWSYDLLAPGEAAVFRRLAGFAGGATLEGAEAAVPDGAVVTVADVQPAIERLVASSLVWLDRRPGDHRYRLLETIREFGAEQLTKCGEAEAFAERHFEWVRSMAVAARAAKDGPDNVVWLRRLEADHDNLRAALRRAELGAAADAGLAVCLAVWWFWHVHGHGREGRDWITRFLRDDAGQRERGIALNALGVLSTSIGDLAAAIGWLERAVEVRRAGGDGRAIGIGLVNLGIAQDEAGDSASAETAFHEAAEHFRQCGDAHGLSAALNGLGEIARSRGSFDDAERLYLESLELDRAVGDDFGVGTTLHNLGLLALEHGAFDDARRYLLESLAVKRRIDEPAGLALALDGLARVAVAEHDRVAAVRLHAAATAHREVHALPIRGTEREQVAASIEALRAAMDADTFAGAWAEGTGLDLDALAPAG